MAYPYIRGMINWSQKLIAKALAMFMGNPRTSILDRDVPFISPKASALHGVAMGVMNAQVDAVDMQIINISGFMFWAGAR